MGISFDNVASRTSWISIILPIWISMYYIGAVLGDELCITEAGSSPELGTNYTIYCHDNNVISLLYANGLGTRSNVYQSNKYFSKFIGRPRAEVQDIDIVGKFGCTDPVECLTSSLFCIPPTNIYAVCLYPDGSTSGFSRERVVDIHSQFCGFVTSCQFDEDLTPGPDGTDAGLCPSPQGCLVTIHSGVYSVYTYVYYIDTEVSADSGRREMSNNPATINIKHSPLKTHFLVGFEVDPRSTSLQSWNHSQCWDKLRTTKHVSSCPPRPVWRPVTTTATTPTTTSSTATTSTTTKPSTSTTRKRTPKTTPSTTIKTTKKRPPTTPKPTKPPTTTTKKPRPTPKKEPTTPIWRPTLTTPPKKVKPTIPNVNEVSNSEEGLGQIEWIIIYCAIGVGGLLLLVLIGVLIWRCCICCQPKPAAREKSKRKSKKQERPRSIPDVIPDEKDTYEQLDEGPEPYFHQSSKSDDASEKSFRESFDGEANIGFENDSDGESVHSAGFGNDSDSVHSAETAGAESAAGADSDSGSDFASKRLTGDLRTEEFMFMN